MRTETRSLGSGVGLGLAFGAVSLARAAVDPSDISAAAGARDDLGAVHRDASSDRKEDARERRGGPAAGTLAVSDGGDALEATVAYTREVPR